MTTYIVRIESPDDRYYERVMTIDADIVGYGQRPEDIARWVRDRVALQEPTLNITIGVWPADSSDPQLNEPAAEAATIPRQRSEGTIPIPWDLMANLFKWLGYLCRDTWASAEGTTMRIHHGVAERMLADLIEARSTYARQATREAWEAEAREAAAHD